VLQADAPTQADGAFSGNTTFQNAWYFDQKNTEGDLTSVREFRCFPLLLPVRLLANRGGRIERANDLFEFVDLPLLLCYLCLLFLDGV
jgi:hypothetical protein